MARDAARVAAAAGMVRGEAAAARQTLTSAVRGPVRDGDTAVATDKVAVRDTDRDTVAADMAAGKAA